MIFRLFLFLILSASVQAEVFQWVDAKGQKHFSDKPHKGAESFQLNKSDSYYEVKKIFDGDTILLANGKKVRFLGINTPEVEGRNKLAQAGGDEAKKWLIKQLKNTKVRLEKDVEKKDKYGRLLAHVFTESKVHLNLQLVKQGLATVSIYPPNLKYTEQLLKAELQAEQANLGLWAYTDYAIKQVDKIKGVRLKGWQRIRGQVKNIRHSRKYSYLNLSGSFSLKIKKKTAADLFPKLDGYIGKWVEARGWVNKHKNKQSMFIRHPSAIKRYE